MRVSLDGDWEKLAETFCDSKQGGRIELALYQTNKLTRIGILCWLPETAYELNLVVPTRDWAEALSMFGRLDEAPAEIIGDLIAAALVEALGAEAAAEVMTGIG